MTYKNINSVYFIGIGGIGMSALARYFNSQGKHVSGYDKTSTTLSVELESEGIDIHYEDLGPRVMSNLMVETTLVIYTPAIPKNHGELNAFRDSDYMVIKRAKALGIITRSFETFAVAGTHGKTTTSSILMHVLNQTEEGCNAFIGGISTNYNSNCIINPNSNRAVVEADEFDRSFLQLLPNHAIITSMDADHLDIYGDEGNLKGAFIDFMNLVGNDGILLVNSAVDLENVDMGSETAKIISYGINDDSSDWFGTNMVYQEERFYFDINSPGKNWEAVEFGLPGIHNADNSLGVFALCIELGISEAIIRDAFKSYSGVKRRFEFKIRSENLIYIDDYAHHPTEIAAFLGSVRRLFPNKKLTTVFQPHLFSRTRDFMTGFAEALALTDELILLDIYPAREVPIEGITSAALLEMVNLEKKSMSSKERIVRDLKSGSYEVILTLGAGDIDTCVESITKAFQP